MSRTRYPWYSYINRILNSRTKNKSPRELAAVAGAMEAADPETRAIIQTAFVDRSITVQGAADELHISYKTACRRIKVFRLDVARRLGLL